MSPRIIHIPLSGGDRERLLIIQPLRFETALIAHERHYRCFDLTAEIEAP
jgi:hypothetical protein